MISRPCWSCAGGGQDGLGRAAGLPDRDLAERAPALPAPSRAKALAPRSLALRPRAVCPWPKARATALLVHVLGHAGRGLDLAGLVREFDDVAVGDAQGLGLRRMDVDPTAPDGVRGRVGRLLQPAAVGRAAVEEEDRGPEPERGRRRPHGAALAGRAASASEYALPSADSRPPAWRRRIGSHQPPARRESCQKSSAGLSTGPDSCRASPTGRGSQLWKSAAGVR